MAASSRHRNRNAVPVWTRLRPRQRLHHSVAPHRPVPYLWFLPGQTLCMPLERLHSPDASLFGKLLAPVAAATPADAQHVCAPHAVCADNARPPGVAMMSAPAQHIHPRNKYCRDRKCCRRTPACRSPDTGIAGRSSHAPHAPPHTTLDKLVQCAHNMQADLAHQAPHRRPRGQTAKILPRAFTSICFALKNSRRSRNAITHRSRDQRFDRYNVGKKPTTAAVDCGELETLDWTYSAEQDRTRSGKRFST